MAQIYDIDTMNYQKMEQHHFVQTGKITEEYWKLNLFYRKVVEFYLEEKLGLSLFDQKICEILESSMILNKEQEDHFFRSSDYQTLYIRNHFYIERLDDDEINLLKQKLKEKVFDDELKKMVLKTLKRVLLYQEGFDEEVCFSRDGLPDSERIPNGALILLVRYSVFHTEETGFLDKYEKIISLVDAEIQKIKEKGKQNLDFPLHIVLVDD